MPLSPKRESKLGHYRNFLAALAAAFALDPEKLLWKPGAKLISIPKPAPPIGEAIFWLNSKDVKFTGGTYIQEPFMYNRVVGGAYGSGDTFNATETIMLSYRLEGNFHTSGKLENIGTPR